MRNCTKTQLSLHSLFETKDLNLSQVLITGCNLTSSIKRFTFSGLKKIKELKLAANQIARIEHRSFDIVMGTLTNLDLRRNRLITLSGDLFQRSVSQTISIKLDENPWHCDNRLNRLMELVKQSKNLQFNSIKCETPKEFAGKNLKYLPSLNAGDQGILSFVEPVSPIKPASPFIYDEFSPNDLWNTDENPWETESSSSIDEWNFDEEHGRNDDIKLKCQRFDQIIALTKPSRQIKNLLEMHDGGIFFNVDSFTHDLKLIEMIHHRLKSNEIVKCINIKINNAIRNYRIETKLQPNQLYQFCIMKKFQLTITPLNCRSFLLIQAGNEPKKPGIFADTDELQKIEQTTKSGETAGNGSKKHERGVNDSESGAWIWKKDQTTLTIAFVLSGIYAFVIGLFISVGLVKLFPTFFQSVNESN